MRHLPAAALAAALVLAAAGWTAAQSQSSPKAFGVYRAIVVNAADPQNAGRSLVRVPDVSGETTRWAPRSLSSRPAARTRIPAPQAGDEVFVMFEQGDPDRPVIIGWVPNRPN